MIKLILIDLHGVLCPGDYSNISHYLADKYHYTAEEVYNALYTHHTAASLGEIDGKDVFVYGLRDLNIPEDPAAMLEKHISITSELNPEVIAIVQEWRSRGIKVVALSKSFTELFNENIRRSQLLTNELVDDAINTFDYKLAKSDPEMIQVLLDKYHVAPNEVIMIDDQEKNLLGAKQVGVHVHFYKNTKNIDVYIQELIS